MKNYLYYIIVAFTLFSCTEISDDGGNTPVVGKWELTSYEVMVEPAAMYENVMAVFYPDGLPIAQVNTGYIFSGNFYRIFDAQGETARFRYIIENDTLTFMNTSAGIPGISRNVIFRRVNNQLRLGNSIFEKETLDLYKNFQSEWEYLNSIAWWEDEEAAERFYLLESLRQDNEETINLFNDGLEQIYFYAVFNKK